MGGFYELSPEEADALNANDGCEPLTFEKYKPHRKQGDEESTTDYLNVMKSKVTEIERVAQGDGARILQVL